MIYQSLAFSLVSDCDQSSNKSNHDDLTSNYHNIGSLIVPFAKAESDFDISDSEDEEEEKPSQVNNFSSSILYFTLN